MVILHFFSIIQSIMTTNITEYIKKTALMFPDKVAVKDTKGELSFLRIAGKGEKK